MSPPPFLSSTDLSDEHLGISCELVPIEEAARWGYRAYRIAAKVLELIGL